MALLDERFLGRELGITNPQLLSALHAMQDRDSLDNRKAVYRALMDSTLMLPVTESVMDKLASEVGLTFEESTLRLITRQDESGELLLLAFTDQDAMAAWRPEVNRYIALEGQELFSLALQNQVSEIIVNPAGPVSKRLTRYEIIALALGKILFNRDSPTVERVHPDTSLLIDPPAPRPPRRWITKLKDLLSSHPQIATAYLFDLSVENQPARLILGIRLAEGVDEAVGEILTQVISKDIQQTLGEKHGLDLMILSPGTLLEAVKSKVPPLYGQAK
jgi:hypothetical protein